jgi:apolipoprotein N-acyltransferase
MPRDLLLYLLAALPLALAYPPFRHGFLTYWAFIPFLLLLEDKNYGSAMRWSYGLGLAVSATVLCSNLWLTLPSVISFALLQPAYFALFGAAIVAARKLWPTGYLLLAPLLWALLEYARSFNEPAAPSLKLGYTQEYFLPLLQYAPGAALYAVSFWIVALNVLLLAIWRSRENLAACLGLAALLLFMFALPYLYSRFVQQRGREWQERAIEVRRASPQYGLVCNSS